MRGESKNSGNDLIREEVAVCDSEENQFSTLNDSSGEL
jgi:hypothetical protein